jgi:hypothetical protein
MPVTGQATKPDAKVVPSIAKKHCNGRNTAEERLACSTNGREELYMAACCFSEAILSSLLGGMQLWSKPGFFVLHS